MSKLCLSYILVFKRADYEKKIKSKINIIINHLEVDLGILSMDIYIERE